MSMLSGYVPRTESGGRELTPQLAQPHDPQLPEQPQDLQEQGDMFGFDLSKEDDVMLDWARGMLLDSIEWATDVLEMQERKGTWSRIYTGTQVQPLHTTHLMGTERATNSKITEMWRAWVGGLCGASPWDSRPQDVGLAGRIDWRWCRIIFDSGATTTTASMWWQRNVIDLLIVTIAGSHPHIRSILTKSLPA